MDRYLIFDPCGREVYAGYFPSPEAAQSRAAAWYGEGSRAVRAPDAATREDG